MKNKKIFVKAILFSLIVLTSCENYLDIVPDRTQELSLLFNRKETAYNALANCYSYLPQNDGIYATYVLASDELTTPIAKETDAIRLMKGQQSVSNPKLSFWSGYGAFGRGQGSLWEAIRSCNILIENIDLVVDMDQQEKNEWKAEASFLKAYYHFLLLNYYGPIPIVDTNIPISASDDEVRVSRNTIDEVISYIVETIDSAILDLPLRVIGSNDLGRVDQVIAKAIKSRVLLYNASPLFNGNSEYYSGFTNQDGENFFNQTYQIEKWQLAVDAASEALSAALDQGISMYNFNGDIPSFDAFNYINPFIQSQYNTRYLITDPWNSELIWGNSSPVSGDWWQLQAGSLMKNPSASSGEAAWQWIAPTLRMAELYYTKNGLPIDEDLTFDYNDRYAVTPVAFTQRYIAQYGQRTAKLNLDREPRFYSSLAFDRGFSRTWGELWSLKMRKGESHGRNANTSDYLTTGYGLKKIAHQDSEGDAYSKLVNYPFPIIRLSELYLNLAEAQNELNGPSQAVFDALNAIRERAGINAVEQVWSDNTIALNPGKHLSQSGLREIIRQERLIELAFEGHRYNDIRRWKLAEEYFSTPVKGWSVDEETETNFYNVIEVGTRSFNSPRDYFHPISFSELSINPNLVQNPGW
ncbi:MAG: RagB/SusD family nutrient uptake outer membrane protein [Flavobacteriaceae bacterium]|nr:RagB/SusD family nutrient uptake outer membrane protein [Flavobacteriaceae bacterium]